MVSSSEFMVACASISFLFTRLGAALGVSSEFLPSVRDFIFYYGEFWTFNIVIDLTLYRIIVMTRLRPLDEVNTHDKVILNDEETSHH